MPQDYKEVDGFKWFDQGCRTGACSGSAVTTLGIVTQTEKECPRTTRKHSSGTPSQPSRGCLAQTMLGVMG